MTTTEIPVWFAIRQPGGAYRCTPTRRALTSDDRYYIEGSIDAWIEGIDAHRANPRCLCGRGHVLDDGFLPKMFAVVIAPGFGGVAVPFCVACSETKSGDEIAEEAGRWALAALRMRAAWRPAR